MTALKWDLIQNNDKIALQLSGLSRYTLLPLWQQRASLSEKQNNQSLIEFDLTEINRIDSAGFALLCDFYMIVSSYQIKSAVDKPSRTVINPC